MHVLESIASYFLNNHFQSCTLSGTHHFLHVALSQLCILGRHLLQESRVEVRGTSSRLDLLQGTPQCPRGQRRHAHTRLGEEEETLKLHMWQSQVENEH